MPLPNADSTTSAVAVDGYAVAEGTVEVASVPTPPGSVRQLTAIEASNRDGTSTPEKPSPYPNIATKHSEDLSGASTRGTSAGSSTFTDGDGVHMHYTSAPSTAASAETTNYRHQDANGNVNVSAYYKKQKGDSDSITITNH